MDAIILTIHTLIVLALVGVVLLQRSEGGALGMGGGGGGFMSGRGAANALTRTTTILAALFFTSSMVLALTADRGQNEFQVLEEVTGEDLSAPVDGEITQDDVLDILGSEEAETPPADVPADAPTEAPAVPDTDETPDE